MNLSRRLGRAEAVEIVLVYTDQPVKPLCRRSGHPRASGDFA